MRLFVLVLLSAALASAGTAGRREGSETGEKKCEHETTQAPTCDDAQKQHLPVLTPEELRNINFTLFTRKHPKEERKTHLVIGDGDFLRKSHFDPSLDTKIIIHGYWSGTEHFHHISQGVLFASATPGVNKPHKNLHKVGEKLGSFLDFLVREGVDPARIHLIGHSLGAHVAGMGSVATNHSRPRVGRITALDPARPCLFLPQYVDLRLRKERADIVDVIHTSGGGYGIAGPIGHFDFYPNGGVAPQPSCSSSFIDNTLGLHDQCSHERAHILFAESITTHVGFGSVHCVEWANFESANCSCHTDPIAYMGENLNTASQQGNYYLTTGDRQPFHVHICNSATMTLGSSLLLMLLLSFVHKQFL